MSQPLRLWWSSRAAPASDQHSPMWGGSVPVPDSLCWVLSPCLALQV